MATIRFDFRKQLRALANRAQDENLARLLAGREISGGPVAPRVSPEEPAQKGRARRLRLNGERVSVRDLVGRPGVRSGEMIADVTRRGNIRLGRTSFKIVPSPEVRRRWFAFVAGSRHQVARSVSGMDASLLASATTELAAAGREQVVKSLQKRRRK